IGSGDNVRVMYDPWLRGSDNRWVSSPQSAGVYQLYVKDLLLDNYKAWDIAKVRNLFSGDAVERILATPLMGSVKEDKVVWEEERNGCYSVKTGYKLAMRHILHSDKFHVAGNWNGIWKAQAPHKARHLLWRLCRGCLPTRYRLLQRRVDCNLNCPVCDAEIEDELHVFFNCPIARESWCAAGLSSILQNIAYQQTNAMDRVFALCTNENSATVGRVAMLLWGIWHNRNDKIWNDNVQVPSQIGRYAFDAWNEWYLVHNLHHHNESRDTESGLLRWEKPTSGWVKCNVDVAFVTGSRKTSVGLCFRDSHGQFMAGMTQWQQTAMSTLEGEAWALLLAMQEARHKGLDRVQFESDSKVLVDAIHMKRRGNSEFLSI
ncbi:ribonuclease H protein, partial [Trifolium medium]|nr:ribonuclease H protein [Trifolium medium]